jgi:hypothetical protein
MFAKKSLSEMVWDGIAALARVNTGTAALYWRRRTASRSFPAQAVHTLSRELLAGKTLLMRATRLQGPLRQGGPAL